MSFLSPHSSVVQSCKLCKHTPPSTTDDKRQGQSHLFSFCLNGHPPATGTKPFVSCGEAALLSFLLVLFPSYHLQVCLLCRHVKVRARHSRLALVQEPKDTQSQQQQQQHKHKQQQHNKQQQQQLLQQSLFLLG